MLKDYQIIILIISGFFTLLITFINVMKIKVTIEALKFLIIKIKAEMAGLEYELDIIHKDISHLSEELSELEQHFYYPLRNIEMETENED